MSMNIKSPAFAHNQSIPARHTCDGQDVSPQLAWSGVPAGAKSLALIVDDPDAPDPAAPQRTFVHWVLYNMPPTVAGLAEGVASDNLPTGTLQGLNDWNNKGYGGPCPPIGGIAISSSYTRSMRRCRILGIPPRPPWKKLCTATCSHRRSW